MAYYNWKGHTIHVEFQPFGVFAWLVAGFVVTVDGRRFIPKFDGLSLNTETEFVIEDSGKTYTGLVRSLGPMVLLPRLRYLVRVGDADIARDCQMLKRWYLPALVFGCLILVLLLAILGAVTLFFIVSNLREPHEPEDLIERAVTLSLDDNHGEPGA